MLTLLHHQDKPLTETPYDTLSPTEGLKNQEKENIRVWISCMKPYGAHPYINIIKININRFQEPSLPLLSSKPYSYFILLEKSPWGISSHLVQPWLENCFYFIISK